MNIWGIARCAPMTGALIILLSTSAGAQTTARWTTTGTAPAQEATDPATSTPAAQSESVIAQPRGAAVGRFELPSNTEILLSMNEELTSSNAKEGDTFSMTVVHDVMLGDYVVIPRGTRAVGEITWLTGKGAFGKSGKMEIELRYVELSGRRIPLEGKFRQEGEGNTVATIGAVVLVGVFGAFVTGKRARIPRGRELTVHTREAVPVTLAGAPIAPQAPIVVQPVSTATTAADEPQ
jgi:hypothetical protein